MMHRRRPSASSRKREGAALLIVLFVLLMATGTAVFSMQATQFEQRAAGSLQQAMRTKYVAESATVGVLAFCYQAGAAGCADLKRAPGNLNEGAGATLREKYALPNWGGSEPIYSIEDADLVGANFLPPPYPLDGGVNNALLPTDDQLRWDPGIATSGKATPYTPSFVSVMEKWDVPNPGETRPRYRLLVSTYGQIMPDDESVTTGETRRGHESISATRAYFDVR